MVAPRSHGTAAHQRGALPSLRGKVAVVTGGSRGIGAATARQLAGAGARVVVAARASTDLDSMGEEIRGTATPVDVREPAAVRALASLVETLGGADVLVNAAGLGRFGAVADLSLEAWDETLDVNLRGTFLVCQALLPGLLRRRGHIFTIGSIASTRVFAGAAAYCAAKWGVLGFTRALAEEVRRQGVRVTAVLPGSVDSTFWDAAGGTDLPRDQMLHPDDVARAILFVALQPATMSVDEITVMPPAGVL